MVQIADRIAYINHDIDDACRAGLLRVEEVPTRLGKTYSERINTLVTDIIYASDGKPEICMSETVEEAMLSLRTFMFEHVYRIPSALHEEEKVRRMIRQLFTYYSEHPDAMPNEFRETAYSEDIEAAVCDYIAGMTDRYAVTVYSELFIPTSWNH